ncbi:transporter [Helicobacter valdiviensis]|uniref:Transporter n=1 Tax=Helicobacter valdiviensis TaxID=1458358 RepID=A0A2W6MVJ1_9HELI|nr:RDD family protein [Helicobacter valdiviensis]PZT47981.1 transporter [Helicobacter valdiviensis]
MQNLRWRELKNSKTLKNSKEVQNKDDRNFATFIERGKAQVIDTFMIYLPLLYFMTYVVVGSAKGFRDSPWAPLAAVLVYALIASILLAYKGQTPGKKAYDLWVVREDGKKVTFLFAFLRFIAFCLSGMSLIGILMPLWRKDKKALHDFLLKTVVIKKG